MEELLSRSLVLADFTVTSRGPPVHRSMVHRKAAHVESLWKPHPPKQQDFEFSSTKWRFHHPPETSIENIQPTSSNPYWRTRTSLPPGVSHLWHFHHMIQLRYRSQDSICQSPSPRGDESVVEWDREFHCNLFYTICTYNNVYTYIYILFFRYTSKDVYTLNCWYNCLYGNS